MCCYQKLKLANWSCILGEANVKNFVRVKWLISLFSSSLDVKELKSFQRQWANAPYQGWSLAWDSVLAVMLTKFWTVVAPLSQRPCFYLTGLWSHAYCEQICFHLLSHTENEFSHAPGCRWPPSTTWKISASTPSSLHPSFRRALHAVRTYALATTDRNRSRSLFREIRSTTLANCCEVGVDRGPIWIGMHARFNFFLLSSDIRSERSAIFKGDVPLRELPLMWYPVE